MQFWNFVHNTIGMHVYIFLALILLVVLAVIILICRRKNKKRTEEYEQRIEEIKNQEPEPSFDEGSGDMPDGVNMEAAI